jgi:hypothetical protein
MGGDRDCGHLHVETEIRNENLHRSIFKCLGHKRAKIQRKALLLVSKTAHCEDEKCNTIRFP